jgi:hypothetical protein
MLNFERNLPQDTFILVGRTKTPPALPTRLCRAILAKRIGTNQASPEK